MTREDEILESVDLFLKDNAARLDAFSRDNLFWEGTKFYWCYVAPVFGFIAAIFIACCFWGRS